MQVKTTRLIDCSLNLYKKFYSLNLRSNGLMRKKIVALKKDKCDLAVINYIKADDKICAWSLLFWDEDIKMHKCYFYVRKSRRKNKLGKKLFNTVEKYSINNNLIFKVYPHDLKSYNFFNKCFKGKSVNMDDSLIYTSNYKPWDSC